MSKNRVNCINCDCFLREKVRRNNDFKNRMLCYNCFKATGWTYYNLKRLYPEKVKEFFKNQNEENNEEIVNFGKYKGLSYDEVVKKDNKYCEWIYKKSLDSDFSQNNFIKYLSNIYN